MKLLSSFSTLATLFNAAMGMLLKRLVECVQVLGAGIPALSGDRKVGARSPNGGYRPFSDHLLRGQALYDQRSFHGGIRQASSSCIEDYLPPITIDGCGCGSPGWMIVSWISSIQSIIIPPPPARSPARRPWGSVFLPSPGQVGTKSETPRDSFGSGG